MEITASEVIGELRKVTRAYEAFKRAEEMAQILVDLEKREKELTAKIETLKAEEADLDRDIDAKLAKVNLQLAEEQERANSMERKTVEAEKRVAEIIANAKSKAETILNQAKADVDKMEKRISELKQVETMAVQKANEAKSAMDSMILEFNRKRDEIMKVFN